MWIWLNKEKYPDLQETNNTLDDKRYNNYAVADFFKKYNYNEKIISADIRISASIKYLLSINEKYIGRGPIDCGGDIEFKSTMLKHYYSCYSVDVNSNEFKIEAAVYNKPSVYSDLGIGHGGFWFEADLIFESGNKITVSSDETWLAKYNEQYVDEECIDRTKPCGEYFNASSFEFKLQQFAVSPLPNLIEEVIQHNAVESKSRVEIEFNKIYCGFLCFDIETTSKVEFEIQYHEIEREDTPQKFIADSNTFFRPLTMKSCDRISIKCLTENAKFKIKNIKFIFIHYPCDDNASSFECSDKGLNKVYDVTKHTLKLCRQSLHLDSPMHQEPLGCTGDYMIESLMNYYTYGDNRLTRLDLIRTADRLIIGNGYMFHTTYSMLWIQMLYDYYMYSGDYSIFKDTEKAFDLLLEKFDSYIGENGLIEKSKDFMFMDWMVCDGYSLHHPPKALGQTVLCAFYYGALKTAEKIYGITNKKEQQNAVQQRAVDLKNSMNTLLFDKEKGLYISGLNTPNQVSEYFYLPKNSDKIYYTKHANILCALYGVCDKKDEAVILEKVLENEEMTDYQPYFAHFVIEAIYKAGLFPKYGMKILRKWIAVVEDCDKGLAEGWHKPEETYSFDHSHAWGGTPIYQMPNKLLQLKILEPGMKKLSICPDICDLEYLNVSFPTDYGKITIRVTKNKTEIIEKPDKIEIIVG